MASTADAQHRAVKTMHQLNTTCVAGLRLGTGLLE